VISGKDRTIINLGKGAVTAPLQVFSLIEIGVADSGYELGVV